MVNRASTGATGTAPVNYKPSRVKSFASYFSKNKKLDTKDLKIESVYRYDIKFEDMETWLLERFATVPQGKLNLKKACGLFLQLPIVLTVMKDNDVYTFWIPKDDGLGPVRDVCISSRDKAYMP